MKKTEGRKSRATVPLSMPAKQHQVLIAEQLSAFADAF
jgi:hypothetical protein